MAFDRESYGDLYPFKSHWLDLAAPGGPGRAVRMHYVDEGDGEPIVCVHGNPTWSFYYRTLVAGLGATRRVIAPDHVGCGLSDKPRDRAYRYALATRIDDLCALLNHLRLDHGVTLVVHDWGGAIGLGAALRRPERIARLVIMNSAAYCMPCFRSRARSGRAERKRLPWRLRLIRDHPLAGAFLVRGLNAFARGAVRLASARGLPPRVRAAYLAPYDSWGSRIATLRFVQDIPLRPGDASYEMLRWIDDNLHRLRDVPALILWGGRDPVFDEDYLFEWMRRFPRAAMHCFPDAGHYVLEDAADACLVRIREFLDRHPVPRPEPAGALTSPGERA